MVGFVGCVGFVVVIGCVCGWGGVWGGLCDGVFVYMLFGGEDCGWILVVV